MAGRPHALVFPFPAQGHINALMQLSQHLVACHGFLITFVNTHHNHTRIMAARRSCPPPYPDIEMVGLSDGLPLEDHSRPVDFVTLVKSMEVHMPPLLQQLICRINQSDNPITCVIADVFCHWIHDIAERAGIACVIGFFPCSVAQFSLIYHLPSLLSSGQLNPDGTLGKDREKITGVPGLPDISKSNLTWYIGSLSDTDFIFNQMRISAELAKNFKAILFNSYYELEKEAVDALVKQDLKILPMGPLVLLKGKDTCYNVAKSDLWVQEEDCLKWLDDKPKSSVLYIAFGSIAMFNSEELHALALGLEASEVNFLWVLRPDLMNGELASLLEGFLDRTKHRAFLASWVPQALVLSHPSIGSFLTHCGWNSTMEAIAMGVPMLVWPYFADQGGNCQQIVEWKVGMPMQENNGNEIDQHKVEKNIRSIMCGVEGLEMSKRAANLKEKARYAISMSHNNLKDLLCHIMTPSNMN